MIKTKVIIRPLLLYETYPVDISFIVVVSIRGYNNQTFVLPVKDLCFSLYYQ